MNKKTFTKKFETPRIFGALVAKGEKPKLSLKKEFAKLGDNFAYLTFQTQKRYLENITLCMKLMDVDGLSISPSFSKAITKFIKVLPSARKAGFADLIVKTKSGFAGLAIAVESLERILQSLNFPSNFKTVFVAGTGTEKKLAVAAAELAGFKLVKPAVASITINAKNGFSIKAAGKTILSTKQFNDLSAKLEVEVLTHPV